MKAIEVLVSHGVKEDRILFLNLVCLLPLRLPAQDKVIPYDLVQIASPEGINNVCSRFPKLRMVSLVLLTREQLE